MRFTFRLLAKAALLAALMPLPAAHAEDGDGPPISFDTADDFSQLRGTDPGQPVEIGTAPPGYPGTVADQVEDGRIGRAEREAPITGEEGEAPQGRRRAPDARDETSYDPLGIRLGSFILLPAIELRGGYTSNAAGSSTGGPSGVLTAAPDIVLRSDWDRHELGFALKGAYDYYTDTSVAPNPVLYVEGNGRIDLPQDWALRLKADYDYQTQSTDSLDYPTGATNPPGVNTFDGGATLDGHFGKTVFQLRSTGTYTDYEDGWDGDTRIYQGYRNNLLTSGAVRVGYQVTPSIAPFVETQLSRRSFNQANAQDGINRDSSGVTIRGGIAYSADPILKGEIALGWRREIYDDPAFADVGAPTIDASLIWSPSPLTEIGFIAATYIDATDDPNASSSLVYDLGLTVKRFVRRNFTLEGDLGWRHEHYEGTDQSDITYEAGMTATWKLNREAWLVGRLSQEYYVSAEPGGNYPTTTATIGIRLQR
ncbi:outer membrane beta-barrel protein [Kaistia dalseonensis]|uniref:Outer membrane beta-barrel protein n=1 Tax=Kaistia dalseonensis TaxID=410840 RepID=A0ABU0HAZ3_9HYPH|nr:outer membrane beta-barrel protein [Kaistia dalseonensis]MCX5496864.1 outer membrane beta-barrel protein [Kaistia dalseonensis]MDQ0439490.1 hypothetical protein [Kaistia dalseonensis]